MPSGSSSCRPAGAKKAKSLIEAELLAKLDVPLVILFDDVRAKAVVGAEKPSGKDITVRQLWEMLQRWPAEWRRPHVVDFRLPDIFCSLPDQCVRAVVEDRGGSFAGWAVVTRAFDAGAGGAGFKDFSLSQAGLPRETDTDALLREILDRCPVRPRVELRTAIDEVMDRVTLEYAATGGSK
jgi:hypothetical protein